MGIRKRKNSRWLGRFYKMFMAVSAALFGTELLLGGMASSAVYGAVPPESCESIELFHSGIPYSQRAYEHFDPSALNEAMNRFIEACSGEGQEEEVLRQYDVMIRESNRLAVMMNMAQIAYDRNVSDEEASGEVEYMADLYLELYDQVWETLKEALSSSYHEVLAEKIGSRYVPYIQYYEKMPENERKLKKAEQDKMMEYDRLAAGEVTVKLEGEEWSYSRLERDTELTAEEYDEILKALSMETNRILGTCFLELVQIRDDIAEQTGYSSYAEYAHESLYGRDYTMRDVKRFCGDAKEILIPLTDAFWWEDDTDAESYEALRKLEDGTVSSLLEDIGAGIASLDDELGEIYSYMKDCQLYDIASAEDEEGRSEGTYTLGFPGQGDGYIFLNQRNSYQDFQSLTHEFGHFAAEYYNQVPDLFAGYHVDVAEIHSQGLELLMVPYTEGFAGKGADAYQFEVFSQMLYASLDACMISEFETAVYSDPDMELEELNRLFAELQDEYELWYYNCYEDEDGQELCYEWVDIPHLFQSPLYYISYGTSALTAMDLWQTAQRDEAGAVEIYKGILKDGMNLPYCETVEKWGLSDIFDRDELAGLSEQLASSWGLEDYGKQTEEQASYDTAGKQAEKGVNGPLSIFVPIVMAALVIIGMVQIITLAVVLVILWFLVRKKSLDILQ